MYIAIEGIDTCGKSTQISLLQKHYTKAIFTKEPGGSDLGKYIRKIILEDNIHLSPKAEFLLFLADRAEHISKIIIPNKNKLIISDRSIISGMAYAKNFPNVKELNLFATDNIIPDLVFLFKIDEKTLKQRLQEKQNDKVESRGITYLLEIQENIEQSIKELNCPHICIDATLDIKSIHDNLKNHIDEILK